MYRELKNVILVDEDVDLLAAAKPLGTAMGACALCAYAVAFCAAIALPETSGADLHAASPEVAGQAVKAH